MNLTERDRAALAPFIEKELARRSLEHFARRMDGRRYVVAPHVKVMMNALEALERGEIGNLLILVPPRHGKTRLLQLFTGWLVGRHPDDEFILATNVSSLADDNSRAVRDLVTDDQFPFDVKIRADASAAEQWRTTAGGIIKAVGIGSAVQGRGAHWLIIDDPVASAEEARALALQRQWEWYSMDASRRLLPDAHTIVAMYRWSELDLAGRILADEEIARDWTVLRLPALAEADDPMGRALGEVLWPPSFSTDGRKVGYSAAFLEMQRRLDPRSFAAQYDLSPIPAEGGTFKEAWFEDPGGEKHLFFTEPRTDPIDPNPFVSGTVFRGYLPMPKERRYTKIQAVDCASKTTIAHDWSVIATLATDGFDFYLLDVWRERVEFPDLIRAVVAQFQHHRPKTLLIEDASAGTPLLQELRRSTSLPIVGVKPHGASKVARAEAVTAYFESGRVKFRRNAPWFATLKTEFIAFPNGRHDDQVDAVCMGLAQLVSARGQQRASRRRFVAFGDYVEY